MATMHADQRTFARLFGVIVGAAVGIISLFPEAMCCGGTVRGILFMFTFPGMIASGLIVQNIHDFPTWLSAIINALLYFILGGWIWKLIASGVMRVKAKNSN
jgi:hypothetical protein